MAAVVDHRPPPLVDPSAELVAGLLATADKVVVAADRLEAASERMLGEGTDKAAQRLLVEIPDALDRLVAQRSRGVWAQVAVSTVILLVVLISGAWLLSNNSYNSGYSAGVAATTDRVKTAEGELWTGINGLTVDQAKVWAALMRENPDIRATIPLPCSHENNRMFCWAKLWTEPAGPPTPSDPPAAAQPQTKVQR